MENLNDRLIKSQLVRSINMIESGCGEVWEDITDLFEIETIADNYYLKKASLFELIKNTPLRITIELCSFAPASGVGSIGGTTQLYVTMTANVNAFLSTNTVFSETTSVFTGRLRINNSAIVYFYGGPIPEEAQRPKILKVEKLMGVN